MIGSREIEGFEALTIASADGGLVAAFVPEAGMVGCSLIHRGEELLGQRNGLRAYVEQRSTMGIPLLHPWANRLGARRFRLFGREVELDDDRLPLKLDDNGLPIHGLLTAAPGWRVERHEATATGAELEASFDFAAAEALLAAFPFPHELRISATIADDGLELVTTVHATDEVPVPIAFGFHPYLRLPNLRRDDWWVEVPVAERLPLDERMLPLGRREPAEVAAGPLAGRSFDDAYSAPREGRPFIVSGAGRRLEVSFGPNYPYAQVYAPAGDPLIALEPMTSPTNALLADPGALPSAEPGRDFEARFSIGVGAAESVG